MIQMNSPRQVSPNLHRRASDICRNAALDAEDDDSDESEVEEKCRELQRIGNSNCSSKDELPSIVQIDLVSEHSFQPSMFHLKILRIVPNQNVQNILDSCVQETSKGLGV